MHYFRIFISCCFAKNPFFVIFLKVFCKVKIFANFSRKYENENFRFNSVYYSKEAEKFRIPY
jgi:hypothetical protein